jgi:hypothetical protein
MAAAARARQRPAARLRGSVVTGAPVRRSWRPWLSDARPALRRDAAGRAQLSPSLSSVASSIDANAIAPVTIDAAERPRRNGDSHRRCHVRRPDIAVERPRRDGESHRRCRVRRPDIPVGRPRRDGDSHRSCRVRRPDITVGRPRRDGDSHRRRRVRRPDITVGRPRRDGDNRRRCHVGRPIAVAGAPIGRRRACCKRQSDKT